MSGDCLWTTAALSTGCASSWPKGVGSDKTQGMHRRQNPSPALRALAASQEGYLTAVQADRLGLPDRSLSRLVAQGHWDRPARGLIDLRPGIDSFDRRLWAASLLAGRPSAIGDWGALHLLGLSGDTSKVVVWVPDDRRPRPVTPARIRRQAVHSAGSRSDATYEGFGVLVELDGRRGHLDARSAFRDLDRDNRHAGNGLLTLRYGSADVRGRPCAVARQVWSVLTARGLDAPFHPCPRCLAS